MDGLEGSRKAEGPRPTQASDDTKNAQVDPDPIAPRNLLQRRGAVGRLDACFLLPDSVSGNMRSPAIGT